MGQIKNIKLHIVTDIKVSCNLTKKQSPCWVKFLVVSSQLDVHNCPSGPTVNKSSELGSNIISKSHFVVSLLALSLAGWAVPQYIQMTQAGRIKKKKGEIEIQDCRCCADNTF